MRVISTLKTILIVLAYGANIAVYFVAVLFAYNTSFLAVIGTAFIPPPLPQIYWLFELWNEGAPWWNIYTVLFLLAVVLPIAAGAAGVIGEKLEQ